MRQVIRWDEDGVSRGGSEAAGGFDEGGIHLGLGGYILPKGGAPPARGMVAVRSYIRVVAMPLGDTYMGPPIPRQQPYVGLPRAPLRLRPVGRLLPADALKAHTLPSVRTLRPVRSGNAYHIGSPPARGLVTPELAEALETVAERFARERGFTSDKPLDIHILRGFKAGSHGHGEGRAADIIAVGGKALVEWKQEWDRARGDAEKASDQEPRVPTMTDEQESNLGHGLYKALQEHGGWRVDPGGWPPYRGVMQLFGPWTATEGPWKTMQIKDPSPYQQQRLADQRWVFQAHRDHIHVAR